MIKDSYYQWHLDGVSSSGSKLDTSCMIKHPLKCLKKGILLFIHVIPGISEFEMSCPIKLSKF